MPPDHPHSGKAQFEPFWKSKGKPRKMTKGGNRMRTRFALVLCLAAAVVLAAAGVASAGLVGSNHDVITYSGLSAAAAKQGACSFCHIPHKATGNKLFPTTIDVSGITGVWGTDTVAQICWSCHGTAGTVGNPAKNIMPFQDTSHKRDIRALATATAGWGDIAAVTDLAGVYGKTDANTISCASCHNVHDNEKRPFIRDITGVTYTEGNFQTFCVMCHPGRVNNMGGTTSHQNHPSGVTLASTAGANIIAFGTISGVFKNAWPDLGIIVTPPSGVGSWNLGGKFSTAGTNVFNCGTCHAVHLNETATWSAADGFQTNGVTSLVAPQGNDLGVMATDPGATTVVTPICAGCHDITANLGPGVVAGSFSHPWNTAAAGADWDPPINVSVATGAGAKFGGTMGTDASLDCQSCHDMHFARLARTASGTGTPEAQRYALARLDCLECHSTGAATNHHPSGVSVTLTGNGTDTVPTVDFDATDLVYVATAVNWANITWSAGYDGASKALVMNEARGTIRTSAATKVYNFGTIASSVGTMTCGTCHGGDGKAHNNLTQFPQMAGNVDQDGMCVDCHGTNPSDNAKNAADKTDRLGTHYVGTINNVNYKWKYNDSATTVTPKSTIAPRYGTSGTNGAIICTSCHTLKLTGLVAQTSSNLGDGETTTSDTVGLLLTPAGNAIQDTAADQADYLCTACHGANPGGTTGQVTHPTQPTQATFTSTSSITNANTGNNFVSAMNTAITCESCHRPHNAAIASTTLILENAVVVSSYLNETVMCNDCHAK
ncbi:MAG: hypothetical protein C4529_01245 [Deltaproteobacteria bacterium]|nr:MAG: hypothetical protein C4529_01245 [Deltaproteobacteria bacterium]